MKHVDSLKLARNWRGWWCDFSQKLEYRQPPPDAIACNLPMDARHLAFIAGTCPDPRLGDNSLKSDWVVTKEWWLATKFTLRPLEDGERAFLKTRGIDHLAEYFVNGAHVGGSESFNQVDYFDVTSAAVAGENELAIRLWSYDPAAVDWDVAKALDTLPPREHRRILKGKDDFTKTRMFWGGDHNPFLMSCGIAMPPEVIVAKNVLVRSVRIDYHFSLDGTMVSGAVLLEATGWRPCEFELTFSPANFEGRAFECKAAWKSDATWAIVEFPPLPLKPWMPFQLGFPHCYQLLIRGGGQTVSVITGFRKLERRHNAALKASAAPSIMDWQPYENNSTYGTAYYKGYDAIREAGERWPDKPREGNYDYTHFINGREFFVMGGSMVPTHLFLSDWSGDYLRTIVRRARESNNNTLRIWGGGYLSGEEFFEAADLEGVMIAQDFLNFNRFTNRTLPRLRQQEKEYRSIVRQLNPHPSVVVLNGGNELLQCGNSPRDPVFQVMARIVREETTNQFFHVSSPVNPEMHGPWHADLDHAARYNSYRTIMCSECGVLAAPNLKSMRRAMTDDQINDVFGTVWQHRQPYRGYFDNLRYYTQLFGPSDRASAADVVKRTQWVQAAGYQYIAEEFRRRKPEISGFTTWEFNEPWLDFNWGVIDHYLAPKHSFWTFKRSCAPCLLSARFSSQVWAPGERFSAEIFFSVEGGEKRKVQAEVFTCDADGKVLARKRFKRMADSDSVKLGEVEFIAPHPPAPSPSVERGSTPSPSLGRGQGGGESSEGTCFFLRLRGTLDDGATIDNDYAFCVLPKADHAPIPVLFITGGCYEDAVSVQFLKAAGFQIDHRIAGPDRKLDPGKVNLAAYRAVVLGPIFNPLTSLGKEFLARLRPAVEGGLGLAWFGYNTSAYLSGRYPVDELRGSALESLLPVTFPEQYYITSEELKSATGHTCIHAHLKKAAEHPIWSGIDMAPCGPDLGIHMRADARPGATVIGVEGAPELKAAPDSAGTPPATPPADSPVLVAGHLGKGNVVAFTGPYGGQNYQGCDFRQWPWANRLISNIIEFAATGNVQPGAFTPHVFAPLLAMPKCTFDASVRELPSPSGSRAETREWEITVRNTGRVPVLYFNVQNDSDDEGDSFDWHVSENHVMLFEGESKVIYAMAVARPGRKVPEGMNVKWEAWNAE